jgi:hypothetical protein
VLPLQRILAAVPKNMLEALPKYDTQNGSAAIHPNSGAQEF